MGIAPTAPLMVCYYYTTIFRRDPVFKFRFYLKLIQLSTFDDEHEHVQQSQSLL